MSTVAPMVLIDSREKCPLVFSGAVHTRSALLPVGDYTLEGSEHCFVVERKRLNEYATCCTSDHKRFMAQVERMLPIANRCIVVEGDFYDIVTHAYNTEAHPNAIIACTCKLVELNVPILWCGKDPRGAAAMVERLVLREFKKQKDVAHLTTDVC